MAHSAVFPRLKLTNMKASLILLCLTLSAVAVFAQIDCNGDGMPTCTGTSEIKYRNFWDPTRYWKCEGNTAVVVKCESVGVIGGFDPKVDKCVEWSKWTWTPVCPVA